MVGKKMMTHCLYSALQDGIFQFLLYYYNAFHLCKKKNGCAYTHFTVLFSSTGLSVSLSTWVLVGLHRMLPGQAMIYLHIVLYIIVKITSKAGLSLQTLVHQAKSSYRKTQLRIRDVCEFLATESEFLQHLV